MGLKKIIASKLFSTILWLACAFAVFYALGSTFNFLPKWATDFTSWFGANFSTVVILIAILSFTFLINKWLNRKKGEA